MKKQNWTLLFAVIVLAVVPLCMVRTHTDGTSAFAGADGLAEDLVTQIRPGYKPWFMPIWTPPSAEIESLLFALQAGLGAGVVGYCIGYLHGRRREQTSP